MLAAFSTEHMQREKDLPTETMHSTTRDAHVAHHCPLQSQCHGPSPSLPRLLGGGYSRLSDTSQPKQGVVAPDLCLPGVGRPGSMLILAF
jgi:hypothetical protein